MKKYVYIFTFLVISLVAISQDFNPGMISGNFMVESQSYRRDSLIGAVDQVREEVLSMGFLNLIYNNSNFTVGMRYEAYLNPLLNIDARFEGQGVPYRYATYTDDLIDVTVGNFYEQFGSGMILRAYEEWPLGFDNSLDGVRVNMRPADGVEITGLYGKQRLFWDKSDGIVRGGDIALNLNRMFGFELPNYTDISIGGSFVSRFEQDNEPLYNLPENVFSWSGRMALTSMNYTVDLEYAEKINDPNATNSFNFNKGRGIIASGAYFTSGLGVNLNVHYIDNMDFRSDRDGRLNESLLSFIPPLTKQHTYRLSSMYPHATQLNGEVGGQIDLTYRIPKNSLLGGKYGAEIIANYSRVNSIDTTWVDRFEYDAPFFGWGNETYYEDINFEILKRINKNVALDFSYVHITYNRDVLEGESDFGKVYNDIVIMDARYRLPNRQALRFEAQHMWSRQDSVIKVADNMNGNWAFFMLEYTIAPHWFISFFDEWNYGNSDPDRQIHYLNGSVAYSKQATRVQLGYGRQRGGILCVGGVCRPVPASNGFYLSVFTSF